jgi:paraquat-inducible protein A
LSSPSLLKDLEAPEFEAVGCIQCDLAVEIEPLAPGQRADCPRCGHLLTSCVADGFARSLALAAASLLLLVMANSFPFLSLQASGLEKVMTLPRTAIELHHDDYTLLAVLVVALTIVIPAIMLSTVIALVVPLMRRRAAVWLVPGGRLLYFLGPWSMVEVFAIGVIVSLVKIVHLAHVEIGLAFWAYVTFGFCFTATMASLDRLTLWRAIERCRT